MGERVAAFVDRDALSLSFSSHKQNRTCYSTTVLQKFSCYSRYDDAGVFLVHPEPLTASEGKEKQEIKEGTDEKSENSA